jgi:YfiH family protein
MDDARIDAWRGIDGLVHGFGRRPPGVEDREGTRRRVAEALGVHGDLQLLRQVHGTEIVAAPCDGTPDADAALTGVPGVLLGIETADCLPILFVDVERHVVAAAHAGWRGTAAGIVVHVIDRLRAEGSDPADLRLAMGPSIGPCCYEVGDELRREFAEDDQLAFTPGPRGRPHLDVRAVNVRQALAAGVVADNVAQVAECTYCRTDLYCSYRREGRTGRMISYVGWER